MKKNQKGQAVLPLVLFIGAIIFEIVLTGTFINSLLSDLGKGQRLGLRAFSLAQSGIKDAFIKVSRNKEYLTIGQFRNYQINTDGEVVTVEISRLYEHSYFITSTAVAGNRKSRLVAEIYVDPKTGLVSLASFKEVSLSN